MFADQSVIDRVVPYIKEVIEHIENKTLSLRQGYKTVWFRGLFSPEELFAIEEYKRIHRKEIDDFISSAKTEN